MIYFTASELRMYGYLVCFYNFRSLQLWMKSLKIHCVRYQKKRLRIISQVSTHFAHTECFQRSINCTHKDDDIDLFICVYQLTPEKHDLNVMNSSHPQHAF